jgi:hypothetical protein
MLRAENAVPDLRVPESPHEFDARLHRSERADFGAAGLGRPGQVHTSAKAAAMSGLCIAGYPI